MFFTIKLCTDVKLKLFVIKLIICTKIDLALNNLQRLICQKTQPTNQPTYVTRDTLISNVVLRMIVSERVGFTLEKVVKVTNKTVT